MATVFLQVAVLVNVKADNINVSPSWRGDNPAATQIE
jgi:hypothetical protein